MLDLECWMVIDEIVELGKIVFLDKEKLFVQEKYLVVIGMFYIIDIVEFVKCLEIGVEISIGNVFYWVLQ